MVQQSVDSTSHCDSVQFSIRFLTMGSLSHPTMRLAPIHPLEVLCDRLEIYTVHGFKLAIARLEFAKAFVVLALRPSALAGMAKRVMTAPHPVP